MARSSRAGRGAALRALLAAPRLLYAWHLAWLLGHRFLALTYRGRKTGRVHETVLEVLRYDPSTGESIVVSAYGPAAGWYRSLRAEPAVRVRTGRLTYGPVQQRFLQPVEAREIAEEFSRRHPLEARLIPTVLGLIGASGAREAPDGRELLASLPMVALRPGSR